MTQTDIAKILKRLNDIETQHTKIHEDLSKQMQVCNKQNEELKKQIEPIAEAYNSGKLTYKIFQWFLAFIFGTGALIVMVKNIVK